MTPDEALDLLGECSDGFGPEADEAWDIVHAEMKRLSELSGRALASLRSFDPALAAHIERTSQAPHKGTP